MADLGLDGLTTGLPTKQIVDQLMAIEKKPLYQLEEDKSELKTAKDAWRDVNSRLDKLNNKITDLKLSSTFDSKKATSTNEDAVTATAENDATAGSYEFSITQLAQKHRVTSVQQTDSTTDLNLNGGNGGSFDININGNTMTINVGGDATLNDVVTAINGDTENDDGSGNKLVNASVVDNTLVIESANTGVNNEISFTDTDNILEGDLGFDLDASGNVNAASELQAAQDANFSVNGLDVTRSSNQDINDVVNNVSFTLKSEGASGTIEVSRDTEKAVSAAQAFVDQYNSVQDFIDKKLDYNANTDQAGTLQGDGTLMRLNSKLRQYVTERVGTTSDYNNLAMVGIEIDKEGTMSLDSDKFKQALNDDPQAVEKLFNADSSSGDAFNGVATKLDTYTDVLIQSDGVIPNKLESYDNMIDRVEDDIRSMEDRLEMRRETLQEQFTAMETAVSEIQNQGSWMQSQLSSMGGTSNLLSSMM